MLALLSVIFILKAVNGRIAWEVVPPALLWLIPIAILSFRLGWIWFVTAFLAVAAVEAVVYMRLVNSIQAEVTFPLAFALVWALGNVLIHSRKESRH